MSARKMPPTEKEKVNLLFGDLYLSHFPEVLEIEQESFEFPWEKDDFVSILSKPGNLGRIAKYEKKIVGFLAFRLERNCIHILNFAVRSDFRRQGFGTQLLDDMLEHRVNQRRDHISLVIHEENKPGWDFLVANKYRAATLLRNYWEKSDDPYKPLDIHYDSGDAYLMRLDYTPRPRFQRTEKIKK